MFDFLFCGGFCAWARIRNRCREGGKVDDIGVSVALPFGLALGARNERHHDIGPDRLAVLADAAHLDLGVVSARSAGKAAALVFQHRPGILRVHEVDEGTAEQLALLVAEHAAQLGVDLEENPLHRGVGNAHRRLLEDDLRARGLTDDQVRQASDRADCVRQGLLTDERATAGEIWSNHLVWLRDASQSGDEVLIYFAGHGDVEAATGAQNDIDRGIVNLLVGFAPLKPAEFVVIRVQQIAGDIPV